MPATDLVPPAGEDLILLRALAEHPGPMVALAGASDDPLARALRASGVAPAGEAGPIGVLLVGRPGDLTEPLGRRPGIVAVAHSEDPVGVPWPGWDDQVLAGGYQSCQFTGRWRLYVADELADRLGPLLACPALPTELAAAGRTVELADEVLTWRAAALERWVDVAEQGVPVDPGTQAALDELRAELDALRSTVSWRVTAPLRAVQTARRRWSR